MRIGFAIVVFLLAALFVVPAARAGAQFTYGARLSTPQVVSGSAGFLIGPLDAPPRAPDAPPPTKVYVPHGVLVQVEPGIGGGKMGLGYVKGLPPVAAGGIQAFYLRTWGQPLWTEKRRSYVGLEFDATFLLKLSVGVMRSVDDGPRDIAFTGGLGFGF
jgi:hypothetical protein